MKVIKEGTKRSNQKYRITCNSCESILEYFHYEAKVQSNQQDGDTHVLGACPVCKNALYNYAPKVL